MNCIEVQLVNNLLLHPTDTCEIFWLQNNNGKAVSPTNIQSPTKVRSNNDNGAINKPLRQQLYFLQCHMLHAE